MSKNSFLGLIFLTWLLIYVPGLFQPALLDDADSVHAEASREMILNHDWVTLHVDGIRYLEKAPLMYWAGAVSFKWFGVSEWQARLPLALGVLGLLWCTFVFGRRAFGDAGGFYAALIMATAPGIYVFTRFLIPDVLVALWLTAGLYFFLVAYEQEEPSRWACWGLAITVALNVLTKGLIGLVFPALVILPFLALTGKLRKLGKMRLVSGTVLFLIVAAPWHVLAAIRNPAQPEGPEKGFLWFYFVNEHFLRYLNKRIPYDYGRVPLWVFWGLVFVWLIPWCAFLIPSLKEIPRRLRSWRGGLDARGRANLLFGLWAALILVFFSFSSTQEYYSIPALPALALLIGGWLEREATSAPESRERRAGKTASAVLFVFGLVGFAAAMTAFLLSKPFPPGTDIGDVLTQHPGKYALALGHMRDLTLESFGLFHTPLWEIGAALLAGAALNFIFRRRGSPAKGNLALTAMMVVVLFCVHQGLVIFAPELSSKDLALAIEKEYQPGQVIIINHDYEWGSTLNFYTGIQVHVLNGRRADLWFGSFFPDAPQIFEDNASFARLWSGPARVYLFTEEVFQDEILQAVDPRTVYVFARGGNKVVLTNRVLNAGVGAPAESRAASAPQHGP